MLNDTHATELVIVAENGAPTGPSNLTLSGACEAYIVYVIEELASGRSYVGLTRRPLHERIASHLAQARRRGHVRPGGLMAALRLMHALRQKFVECFSVRALARARTADEARTLERDWVERLDCRTPFGFNSMPGGSSVGGIDNSKSITILRSDGLPQTYPSIRKAIDEINDERARNRQTKLEPRTIYARVAGGWKLEEAFEIERHQRPQGTRKPFALGDEVYTSLRAASEATGLLPATIRSRLQRAGRSSNLELQEVGRDRRARDKGPTARLHIPWPRSGELLTAAAFAARTGLPKATVIHRWHQWRTLVGPDESYSPEERHHFMLEPKRGPGSRDRATNQQGSDREPL